MKRCLRLLIGIAISLLSFYLVLRTVDLPRLWETFRAGNYLYLIPALLLLIVINWIRAYRWRLLMRGETKLSLLRLFHVVNIGYLFNNVLPAKAGELVRAYLVARTVPGGIGQAFSALLIERLLDVLCVVVLLVILIPFVALPVWAARAGLLFGGVAIVGTIALLVLSRFGERGLDWLWRLVGRIPVVGHVKVKEALRNLLRGLGVLTDPKLLPGALVGSAGVWFGYALLNYILMAVFGLTHQLSFWAAALVLCATGLAMILPSSPGAMGVFEGAAVLALSVFGIGDSVGFGYALGLHLFTNVVFIVLGLVGLLAEGGVSYSTIRNEALDEAASQSLPDAGIS